MSSNLKALVIKISMSLSVILVWLVWILTGGKIGNLTTAIIFYEVVDFLRTPEIVCF